MARISLVEAETRLPQLQQICTNAEAGYVLKYFCAAQGNSKRIDCQA
jgi:hypothetical protein